MSKKLNIKKQNTDHPLEKTPSKTLLIPDSDINKYKKAVDYLARTKSSYLFNNSSSHHANVVISNIIKYCEKEVKLFDKDLSGDVADLDDELYLIIENAIKVEDKTIKIVIRDNVKVQTKFSNFLRELNSRYPHNLFVKVIKETELKIVERQFNSLINFAIGDNDAFRVEITKERKAICSFNDSKFTRVLTNTFDRSFQTAENAF